MVKRTCGVFTFFSVLAILAGCVGTFNYAPPAADGRPIYVWTLGKSKEDIWRALTVAWENPHLVFDRVDKDAGVITFLYRGDPEPYVDCGRITSYVKNLRGERTYRFPAASAATEYELVTGREILLIDRKMSLEGRLAVKVVAIGDGQTQVAASAEYALTRTLTVRDAEGRSQTSSDTASFRSGLDGAFSGPIACRPSGVLENEVASALAP